MPPRSRVGKSKVTPCKHDLLNSLLGREAGVLKGNPMGFGSYGIVDLTAGDGVPYGAEFTRGCSPGIILKHSKWIAERTSVQPKALFIEKQEITYERLRSNLEQSFQDLQLDRLGDRICVDAKCMNSKEFIFPNGIVDASFIYNDPNHIEDWCLTPELLGSVPRFTTSLSTLGCNVSGLKRIDLHRRREWFYRVELISETILQRWHDACLFSVGGADQWAYLITAPAVWRDAITQNCIKAATKIEGREAEPQIAWRKADPFAFYQLERFLFLTKQEFNDGCELV
jgi:hypothetical protein